MAMMAVQTYNPSDVRLTIGGYQLAGWNSITIARNKQGVQPVPGIRGKHTRVPTNDTSATVTISMLQTSPSHDVMSAIHGLDLVNGTGRLELSLRDGSGRSVFNTIESYITGYPETTYSDNFEYRTWTIYCQTTNDYVVGGNTKAETTLADTLFGGISGAIGNIF